MLLNKTYFSTSSPAQPFERPEYELTSTSKKYHYVFDLYKQNKKQTTESQATLEQCLGLIQSLLSVWKGKVVSANARTSHVCGNGGAGRALPAKPPPSPGIEEQLVSDGHLHKTIKHLMLFPKDKNESDDAIPKELLFLLLS